MLKQLAGPVLAGLVIDAIDLMTLGPVGLYTGLVAGGLFGYWLAPDLGFARNARWIAALLTGVYCTLPLTGFVPAASIAAGVARLLLGDDTDGAGQSAKWEAPAARSKGTVGYEGASLDDAVDVEYESVKKVSEERGDR